MVDLRISADPEKKPRGKGGAIPLEKIMSWGREKETSQDRDRFLNSSRSREDAEGT